MNAWRLPTSVKVGDKEYEIRTDFRDVLYAISFFENPNYTLTEAWNICLRVLYKDFKNLPFDQMDDLIKGILKFIDYGNENTDKAPKPKLMDWEQDAQMIVSSVNKVLGKEIRAENYVHWWTFLGAYMEIGEGAFSQIVDIRRKKAKGKKLEKWEREFYTENKDLIDMKKRYSEDELKEQERIKAMLG